MDSVEKDNIDAKNLYHDMVKETHNVESQASDSDSGDMYRMGKEQQFKVRVASPIGDVFTLDGLLIIAPAYIRPIDNDNVHFHGSVVVGVHACVMSCNRTLRDLASNHGYRRTPIFGIINGGLAGIFWSFIWTFFGFCAIVLSLAEMASM
jgi:hypothetical protein